MRSLIIVKKMLLLSLSLFITSCIGQNEEDKHTPNVSVEFVKLNGHLELNEPEVSDKHEQFDPHQELERLNNEMRELLEIINLPREKQAELKKIDIRAEYMRLVNEIIVVAGKMNWCVDIPCDDEYLDFLDEDTQKINWGDFE